MTSLSIESVLSSAIEEIFLPYCRVNFDRADIAQSFIGKDCDKSVSPILLHGIATIFYRLTSCQKCKRKGLTQQDASAELRRFLDINIDIPLGLKIKLYQIISALFSKEEFPIKGSCSCSSTALASSAMLSLDSCCSPLLASMGVSGEESRHSYFDRYSLSVIKNLWNSWRLGKISNNDYLIKLTEGTVLGTIVPSQMNMAVSLALIEGGYAPGSPRVQDVIANTKLKSFESSIGDLDDIESVFPSSNGDYIDIFSFDKIQARVSLTSGVLPIVHSPSIHRMSSPATSLQWTTISNTNSLIISQSQSHKRDPILLVGDSIQTSEGLIDIDSVISVDAILSQLHSSSYSIALLLEGRWIPKAFLTNSDTTPHILDGVSEICREEDNKSPNGSGVDEAQSLIPDYSYQTELFVVFVTSIHEFCTIQKVVSLLDKIEPDQRPIGVKLICANTALVHGTNGLLSSVVTLGSVEASLTSYKDHNTFVSSLTIDTLKKDSRACCGKVSSHAPDSVVVHVSYHSGGNKVVTADSSDVICLWTMLTDARNGMVTFELVDSPFHIGKRVYSLSLSPSGEHVAVGLRDELVLLRVTGVERGFPTPGLDPPIATTALDTSPLFYERCVLDKVEGKDLRYCVSFEESHLQIWRISTRYNDKSIENMSDSDSLKAADSEEIKQSIEKRVLITTWCHQNVDSFENRFGFDESLANLLREFSSLDSKANKEKELCSEMDQGIIRSLSAAQLECNNLIDQSSSLLSSVPATVAQQAGVPAAAVSASAATTVPTVSRSFSPYGESFVSIQHEFVPVYHEVKLDFNLLMNDIELMSGNPLSSALPVDSLDLSQSGSKPADDLVHSLELPTTSSNQLFQPQHRAEYVKHMRVIFRHDHSSTFLRVKSILAVYGACFQVPTLGLICAALEMPVQEALFYFVRDLSSMFNISGSDARQTVTVKEELKGIVKWICSTEVDRIAGEFWIDSAHGHNRLCSLYLKYCGNKSIAVEHVWHSYLQTYGPSHLRRSNRGLRALTEHIRKIDETANIKYNIPYQIGYISGLQEIYARRVGLGGSIPKEIGELKELRVLSMGNNRLTGELPKSLCELTNLQRIVLHQNNLFGEVPHALGELGCIVNLAGNPRLEYGPDVPSFEREALVELHSATRGNYWNTRTNWCSSKPVAKWYKVGVLCSHVHSIVMSSNGMEGNIPRTIWKLKYLRMIELATMQGLTGPIPRELCTIVTLRRLCICRCGLTGPIPEEIGSLIGLEELQLFGNRLTGLIPQSLGNLTRLKLLSLGEYTGGNDFSYQELPKCIAKLCNLEALFMANCNIIGKLPTWIGSLTDLRQLDLQHNNLTGELPRSIGRLENLLYLNIKDNNRLGGHLPIAELSSLVRLNRLSLIHCNFLNRERALESLHSALPRCKIWL